MTLDRSAHLVAAGVAVIAVTYGFARFAYGLFVPELRAAFALSSPALGAIAGTSYVAYGLGLVAAALWGDRHGPRRTVLAAVASAAGGTAIVGLAHSPGMLAAGVALGGLSTGLASPALAAAIEQAVAEPRRGRAQTVVNAGTSVGVLVAAPVALLAAGRWRPAWLGFALVAVVVVAVAYRVVPSGTGGARRPVPRVTARPGVGLVGAALLLGLTSALYWNFARDLVVEAGRVPDGLTTLLWLAIGAGGLGGAAVGDLVTRLGLRDVIRGAWVVWVGAFVLLAVGGGGPVAAFTSAALFGAAYMALTGLLILWAVAVTAGRPAAGVATAFLALAIGQAAGSPAAGAVAGAVGLPAAFAVFGALGVLGVWVVPRRGDRVARRRAGGWRQIITAGDRAPGRRPGASGVGGSGRRGRARPRRSSKRRPRTTTR